MEIVGINYRYHFTTLTDTQKTIYELVYKKINSCGAHTSLPFIHVNEIWLAFEAMLLDNPLIFYTDGYKYTKDLNKKKIEMQPEYKLPSNQVSKLKSMISSSLSFVESVKKSSDFEKVKYVHDYILDTVTYDYSVSKDSHSVVGVALSKSGVCEGIAKYVKLALDCLSIKSIVVTGRAVNPAFEQDTNEPHAWNMVEVDGKWYHMDVTFDLTLKHKTNRYDYFLVGDKDISISHTSGQKLPPTSNIAMDYYSINGLTAANFVELGKLIYTSITNKQRIVQLRLLNVGNRDDQSEMVLQEAEKQCKLLLSSRGYSIAVRYNNLLWVFEIEIT